MGNIAVPGDVSCDPGVVYPEELHVFSGLNNRGGHDGGRHVEIAKAVGRIYWGKA